MQPLDDTDRAILRLLLEDGRRPYSEIGEAVDLSGPAVSDRIDRLRDRGIVRGFTVDLDRSVLREGTRFLLELDVVPGKTERVADAVVDGGPADHVLRTADQRVLASVTLPEGDATAVLENVDVLDAVTDISVTPVAASTREAGLGDAEFAPECVECGNTVDAEGTRATLGGESYYFCCESCEGAFRERYETLEEGA